MKNFKVIAIAAGTLLFLTPCVVTSQNLILNAGFETGGLPMPNGNALPYYPATLSFWSAASTDGELISDPTLAHTGTGFMSMLQNASQNMAAAPWLGVTFGTGYDRGVQIIQVTPATAYELQVWVRSGNNLRYQGYDAGTALIQVEQFTPTAAVLDSFTVYTPLTWQQSTFHFTTGSLCTSVAVLFSVMDAGDADAWFDDADLHLDPASSVHQPQEGSLVSVYPTMLTDKINIHAAMQDELTISVYDAISKKVMEQTFSEALTTSVKNFSKGVYFYEIKTKNDMVAKGKLFKN